MEIAEKELEERKGKLDELEGKVRGMGGIGDEVDAKRAKDVVNEFRFYLRNYIQGDLLKKVMLFF